MKKIISFIKKNIVFLTILIILVLSFEIEFPYYIEAPGGLLNVSDRVDIEDYKTVKNINMTYVTRLKANAFSLLISFFNKHWDVSSNNERIEENETIDDVEKRSNLLLNEANSNAILIAYKKAKKQVLVNNTDLYVTYIDKSSLTDLKIGDQILKVNSIEATNYMSIGNEINNSKIDEIIKFEVLNNNKKFDRYAYKKNFDNEELIGIVLTEEKSLTTEPKIKLNFKSYESGPSGGLMMSLAIYYSLVGLEPCNGLKIAGTGTINELGEIGPISGLKYKLKGAVDEGAKIFLVPNDINYDEAVSEVKKHNYKIKIIGVSTFDDAILKLKNSY